MNMLWSWIEANTLSLAAVEVLIKLTLLLGAVAGISLLTNFTAATKRLLWSAAIVIALLLPLSSSVLPAIEIPLITPAQPQGQTASVPATASEPLYPSREVAPRGVAPIGVSENPAQSPTANMSTGQSMSWISRPTAIAMMVLVWLLGMAIFSAKLWRQYRHVREIKDNARHFSGNHRLVASGTQDDVPIFISDDIATPITLGALNPVIVLPAGAQTWDAEKLRSAIAHELAHVQGRDNFIRACASLLCALYWFHPLAWYSARKLYEEQEKAADNAVLNQGVSASVYAQNLLDIVKSLQGDINRHGNTISASMASYSFFPQRMRSILSDSQNRQGMGPGKAAVMVTAIIALALPVTLLTTQASRAQNNEEEPTRYIDFAQNTVTDENPNAQPSKPGPAPSEEDQVFYDLDAQMTAAFNGRELDKLVSLYTDDAEVIVEGDSGSDTYRGKSEIEKYWDDLLDTDMTIRTQVQSVKREGNQAQVKVRYWSSFDTDLGNLDDFFGGETTTDWQLINGQWRIVNDRVHEPDYVSEESIDRIVGAALKPLEDMDWEGFGESIAATMEAWGEGMAANFSGFDGDWDWDTKSSNDPLINAVESGNSKTVKILLENGADANTSASWGRSALYLAAEIGNEDMVKQLLRHDADVDAASRYGKTALFVAAENGNLDIVKRLVDYGADVNKATRSNRTPLSAAAKAGHDKVVEYLLEHGAKVGV